MRGKLILITGGSSGIGKATAKVLHQQGAHVIIQARNVEKLQAAAQEIDSEGKNINYYSTDLTNEKAVAESAERIIADHGVPDIVINSAGAGEWLSLKEASLSHYRETINSPYLATALTCKVFYDKMESRGEGHFIIINSAACFFSFPGATGYGPARWAMLGFARSLQADFHHTKFKVSMIAFGKVDSPYFQNNPISEQRIPKISNWLVPTLSTEETAETIRQTVYSKKKLVIKPKMMAFLVYLNRLFPSITRWLMRITTQL